MSDLDLDVQYLVKHLAELQAKISELGTEAESIKAELRQRLAVGDHTIDGRAAVRLSPNKRFNAEKALAYVPEELREACYDRTLVASKVKSLIAPAVLPLCMDEIGDPKVQVL